MYSILLVDDENHILESVKSDIVANNPSISDCYTANNIKQAKKIFSAHVVDILICDIEMPQGSGIDLLTWVNDNYPNTVAVFMTCHTDFKYVKQAIQLGCIDYLIKPVSVSELKKVIGKAISTVDRNNEVQEFSRSHQLWTKNHTLVTAGFWLDVVNRTVPLESIKDKAANLAIPITDDMEFIPLLVTIQRAHQELNTRKEKILEHALKRLAEERIITRGRTGQVIQLYKNNMLIILTYEQSSSDRQSLKSDCEEYVQTCNTFFHCDLSCYIGNKAYVHEVAKSVEELIAFSDRNVAFDNAVFLFMRKVSEAAPIEMPDMKLWAIMLNNDKGERVISEAVQYLEGLVKIEGVNSTILQKFYQDFLQMVYLALDQQSIHAHELFCDPKSIKLAEKSVHSIVSMQMWVKHLVTKVIVQMKDMKETNTVVENVKEYIDAHLGEDDLSRESIAKSVFLNPDYLSRLFKKETNLSLSEYLIQTRIKKAQELLEKTDISISRIASSVGYSHFSHFSKMFRKNTGFSPMDYRKLKK